MVGTAEVDPTLDMSRPLLLRCTALICYTDPGSWRWEADETARVHHVHQRRSLAWPRAARAQQPGKIYRIGVFTAGAPIRSKTWSILIDALKEMGLTEGKNIAFEPRFADNNLDRLPELAAELVSLNVDVILAIGTQAPLAAKRASATIPIVMANAGDPLGSGLVVSFARPGGNVTGMSLMAPDLGGKRLELLKEILPRLSRVAVIWNAANPYSALVFEETRGAAKTLAIELTSVEVRGPGDFTGGLDSAVRKPVEALVTVEDPLTFNYRKADRRILRGKPFACDIWAPGVRR